MEKFIIAHMENIFELQCERYTLAQNKPSSILSLTFHQMNNPLHYPDLDRCRELTKLGFPRTAFAWSISKTKILVDNWEGRRPNILCPSVSEMLDVIPDTLHDDWQLHIWKNNDSQYWVVFEEVNWDCLKTPWTWFETLPNALADLIIWLVENNYLTFTKNGL